MNGYWIIEVKSVRSGKWVRVASRNEERAARQIARTFGSPRREIFTDRVRPGTPTRVRKVAE